MDPHQPSSPDTPPTPPTGPGQPARPTGKSVHPRSPQPAEAPRYPKPPALPVRLLMLIFRPESWAEAARYQSKYTVVPLALAIVLACLGIGVSESARALGAMRQFAANYDRHYPPLEFTSAGTLRATGELKEPIRFQSQNGATVLIDPTGKTAPESIKAGPTFFVTDKDIWAISTTDALPTRVGSLTQFTPLVEFPAPAASAMTATTAPAVTTAPAPLAVTINGTTMNQFLAEESGGLVVFWTMVHAFGYGVANALWAVLMMLLICPLVLLGAAGPKIGEGPDRRLILPRRAAYRMSAAVLIPLIVFGGVLHALGKPVMNLLGFEGSTLFWFFAAAGLALWTGVLAKRLFTPGEAPRRAT